MLVAVVLQNFQIPYKPTEDPGFNHSYLINCRSEERQNSQNGKIVGNTAMRSSFTGFCFGPVVLLNL